MNKQVTCFNPHNKNHHTGIIVAETDLFNKVFNSKDDTAPYNAEWWPKEFCREVVETIS